MHLFFNLTQKKQYDANTELVVGFNASGCTRVCNAICFVVIKAAGRHCSSECALIAVTDLSPTKLVESRVQIAVNDTLSYTDQQHISVHVVHREAGHSGQRKRAKYFGPINVVAMG